MEWGKSQGLNWRGALKAGVETGGKAYSSVLLKQADDERQRLIEEAKTKKEKSMAKYKVELEEKSDKKRREADLEFQTSEEYIAAEKAKAARDQGYAIGSEVAEGDAAFKQKQKQKALIIAQETERINNNPDYKELEKKKLIAALHGDKVTEGGRKKLTVDQQMKIDAQAAEEAVDKGYEPGTKKYDEWVEGRVIKLSNKYAESQDSGFKKPPVVNPRTGQEMIPGADSNETLTDSAVKKSVDKLSKVKGTAEEAAAWQELYDKLSPESFAKVKAAWEGKTTEVPSAQKDAYAAIERRTAENRAKKKAMGGTKEERYQRSLYNQEGPQ